MEIYLVRHTTPNIEKGICYGQSDLDVTSSFNSETKIICQQLPITEISTVYSSPLLRCQLLATSISNECIFDKRLKELHFGDWEMQPWDAINKEDLEHWMKDFVNVPVPNGESYTMLQDRILDFFKSLDHTSSEKIAIISHAGPMRALLAHLRGISLQDSFNIKIGYGEVIKI